MLKPHEIFARMSPAVATQLLSFLQEKETRLYKATIETVAKSRKLRPVFIEKKSMVEQYAWIHKTLKLNPCENIGEHLLQAYLMAGQQSLLAMFCDGMGIPHDGKGSVVGDLPKNLDTERLNTTIDRLVDVFDPKLLTLYLHCFNMQVAGGWPVLTAKIESDERLVLA